ncbi:hypothetical protein RCL1_004417 [Eukaryota sp. TZLM3-RCL]
MSLKEEIARLSQKYLPLAEELLKEAIRIPADYVETDPICGTSNHEGPRLHYLKQKIVEIGAVSRPEDVYFDEYGNLIWDVTDYDDGVPREQKKTVWYDGHTDTVFPLREQWLKKIGGGIDCFNGLTDASKVNEEFLRSQLGYLPPREEWEHIIFGRGSADQLAGVISQIVSTKIMLELKHLGALKNVYIKSIGTVTEEDNDGVGPMMIYKHFLSKAPSYEVPDAVLFTEGTGDARVSALGIYRGQRGRMIIEVEVIGQSCHGSMPYYGKNPLEYGAAIIVEANQHYNERIDILDDPFLSHGTRTASWCKLDTPSDCAVPDRFVFRFDRRITVGETPEFAVNSIEKLSSVAKAREAGCIVTVKVPRYTEASWTGMKADNDMIYMGWKTPEEHPSIQAAIQAYKDVITPYVTDEEVGKEGETFRIRRDPRVGRFVFSTDGVSYSIPKKNQPFEVPASKNWIEREHYIHPPMFGFGAGHEQNTHKIGEFVDRRELKHAIALMSAFPSTFANQ